MFLRALSQVNEHNVVSVQAARRKFIAAKEENPVGTCFRQIVETEFFKTDVWSRNRGIIVLF